MKPTHLSIAFRDGDELEVLRRENTELHAELARLKAPEFFPFGTNECPACGSRSFADVGNMFERNWIKRKLIQKKGAQPYFRRKCSDCGFKFKECTKLTSGSAL